MPLWALVAAVNLAIGVAIAANPDRQSDLATVQRWTRAWLFDGVDLYAPLTSGTDYPPHAILFLSPLALLPGAATAPLWAALNLLLAVVAPVLAARIARPNAARADIVCLALLFLGWSGTKALLQFTLLTLVLGLAAMRLAEKRPRWSAVCLGLALMKPQIGLPFLLWAGFARHTRVAAGGLLVVAAGSLAWCARAGADPFHVARRYLEILQVYYAGRGSMVGVSQAGPLIHRLTPDTAAGVVTGVLSAVLLGIVCAAALRARRGPGLLLAVPAMACIWSLTTFYHLTYGFVLLLPLASLLLLDDAIEPDRWRLPVVTFWTMQLLLVVDVPGLLRRFGPVTWRTRLTEAVFQDWYRLALIALFAAAWAIQRRIRRATDHNCMTTL